MFERTSQDFLLRQIQRFALGVLRAIGIKSEDGEEEELDSREAEALLGFPLDVVAGMELEALVAFLDRDGEPDPHRMLLTGLMLAHRAEEPAHRPVGRALRLNALGLIVRAVEVKPDLMSPRVAEVLQALAAPGVQ